MLRFTKEPQNILLVVNHPRVCCERPGRAVCGKRLCSKHLLIKMQRWQKIQITFNLSCSWVQSIGRSCHAAEFEGFR